MKTTAANVRLVTAQIKRLSSIEVLNDAQASELTQVALVEFPSPEALTAGISVIVSRSEKVPTPAQLRRFAREHHRKQQEDGVAKQAAARQRANPNCATCSGYGQVYAWHLITYVDGRKQSIERITWEQYQNIGPKLDKSKQRVYELPVPCACTEAKPAVSHQQQSFEVTA